MTHLNIRSELRRLISGFATYGLGDFVLFGLSYFVLIPTLTHQLVPEEYGIVSSLNAINIMLVSIMQFGLPSTVMRYFFLHPEGDERRNYFCSMWLFALLLSGLLSISFLMFGRSLWDSVIRIASFDTYAKYIVWSAFFQIPLLFSSVLLRAREKPRLYIALSIAQFACLTLLVVYHVAALKQGALGQVRGVFYTNAIFAVISTAVVLPYMRFQPKWRYVRGSVSYALPIFLSYLIGFFVKRANVLILQYFVVGSAVGIYGLGMQFSNLILMLSAAFEKVFQPFLYSLAPERASRVLSQYLRISVPFYMLTALGMGLFAPEILKMLSAQNYAEAWIVIAITGVGTAFVSISSAPASAIYYVRRSGAIAWVTAATAVVNVVLSFFVLPYWGMVGALWINLIVGAATLVLNLWFMQRYLPTQLNYYNMLSAIGLGIALLVLVGWMGTVLLPGLSLFASITIKAVALVCYVLFLWVMGVFPSNEDYKIRQYVSGWIQLLQQKFREV